MKPRFFFDASALIRHAEGRPAFAEYAEEPIVTERGHVYEYSRYLVKAASARHARAALASLRADRLEPTDDDLVEAAKLASRHVRLSAQDALGYIIARRERLTFLTTDRALRGLPGVKLVDAE